MEPFESFERSELFIFECFSNINIFICLFLTLLRYSITNNSFYEYKINNICLPVIDLLPSQFRPKSSIS